MDGASNTFAEFIGIDVAKSSFDVAARRAGLRLKLSYDAAGLRPFYGSVLVAARASEAAGDAAGAAVRWRSVLDAMGPILQEGFPPDIELARAHVARVQAR